MTDAKALHRDLMKALLPTFPAVFITIFAAWSRWPGQSSVCV